MAKPSLCDYPYGEMLRSYTTGGNVNDKYKFTEKERDTETDYDYFGARFYDSKLVRWLQVDPLADKYPGWSPYNYTLNNPLKYFDPDGMNVTTFIEEDGTVRNIDDGSNAVFKVEGKGVNKHYEFQGFDLSQKSGIVNITTLIQEAQNLNLSNDALNPTESATYCNFATQNIMKSIESVGIQGAYITGMANKMQQELIVSERYYQVDYSTALYNAQKGGLSLYSSLGKVHGHVGTFSVGNNILKGEIANVGKNNGFMNLYRNKDNPTSPYSKNSLVKFFILIIK